MLLRTTTEGGAVIARRFRTFSGCSLSACAGIVQPAHLRTVLAVALGWSSTASFAQASATGVAVPGIASLAAPPWLFYLVLAVVTAVWLFGLSRVLQWLRKDGWNLSQALSEEAVMPTGTPAAAAAQLPPLVASASRMIALLGAVVMAAFFIGLGYWVIWALFNGQSIEPAKDTLVFFLSGTALFTPYAANRISSIFQS
jgi:hypothetical protein